MKCLLQIILLCCIVWQTRAYYTDQYEQTQQKYELNDSGSLSGSEQNFFGSPHRQTYDTFTNDAQRSAAPMFGAGLDAKSSEYAAKVTQIPSGSMFALSDKGGGNPLEFQSPFSKEPYSIVFRTHSMPVKIKQQHQTNPPPEVEFVRSQEEPHQIKHEVVRPIIQEVHEIIQPYRRVVQEVKPVVEQIHTIVSKGESRNQGGGGGGGGMGGGDFGSGGGGGGGYANIKGGHHGGGFGGNVAYSENQPRFVSAPKPQKIDQFRSPASGNQAMMSSSQHYATHPQHQQQFVPLTRGPTPHYGY